MNEPMTVLDVEDLGQPALIVATAGPRLLLLDEDLDHDERMDILERRIRLTIERPTSKNIRVIDVPKLGRESQIVRLAERTLLLLDAELLEDRRAFYIASLHRR